MDMCAALVESAVAATGGLSGFPSLAVEAAASRSGGRDSAPAKPALLPPVLLDRVRGVLKQRHYSARTEAATLDWLHRFYAFHGGRAVETMGEPEVRAFLGELAGRPEVSVAARNQARAALLILFHGVLGQRFNCTDGLARPARDGQGPLTLDRAQVKALLDRVEPACKLLVSLLYGCGLRLGEACQLRVRDLDLAARRLHVRGARDRGAETRTVMLPECLVEPLRQHLATAEARHRAELAKDAGVVSVPEPVRLAEPGAPRAWDWQWVFPAARIQRDPVSNEGRRTHQHEAVVQRALQVAARAAGHSDKVNPHTLRHCFTVHLLDAGHDNATVQALLGVGTGGALPATLPRSPLDV